jgi:hypothetical protein
VRAAAVATRGGTAKAAPIGKHQEPGEPGNMRRTARAVEGGMIYHLLERGNARMHIFRPLKRKQVVASLPVPTP